MSAGQRSKLSEVLGEAVTKFKEIDVDYFEKYIDYANRTNYYMIHSGIVLTKFEKDFAEAELVIEKSSLNFLGTMHGGLYLTIADCVAGSAARGDGRNYVTLGSSFDFIRSAKEGKVRAIAEVHHRGRTICRVATRVIDEQDRLLAEGSFTMFCLQEPFVME